MQILVKYFTKNLEFTEFAVPLQHKCGIPHLLINLTNLTTRCSKVP